MILLKDQRKITPVTRRRSGYTMIMLISTTKELPDVKKCGRLMLKFKRLEVLLQGMLVASIRTIIIKSQKNALVERQYRLSTTLVKSFKTLISKTFLTLRALSIVSTTCSTTNATSNNGCMISVLSASTTIVSQNNYSKMKWDQCSK